MIKVLPRVRLSEEISMDLEKRTFYIKNYLQEYALEKPFTELTMVDYIGSGVIKFSFRDKKTFAS